MPKLKQCLRCKQIKEGTKKYFSFNRKNKDKLSVYCLLCTKEISRQRRMDIYSQHKGAQPYSPPISYSEGSFLRYAKEVSPKLYKSLLTKYNVNSRKKQQ